MTKDVMISIALVLLFILSNVHSRDMTMGQTSIRQGRKRRAEIVQLDESISNQVHVSVINQKYHELLKEQDNFLSSTVRFNLYPVQYAMNESQAAVFEKALTSFLRAIFSSQPEHRLRILSTSVTNIKSIGIADAAKSKPTVKDQALEIQTVISAQQQMDDVDSWISPDDFGDIVINLCSIYEDELLEKLQDVESKSSENNAVGDKIFNNVQTIDTSFVTVRLGSGLTALGKGILVCFCILAIVLIGLFFLVRSTRKKQIHEGLKNYKKEKNLRDLIQDKYSDLTFVPYSEAQKSSASFKERTTTNHTADEDEDDERNITSDTELSESELNDTFESNIYYDHHTVASMSTIGLSSISEGGSQISTDGSIFMGQCVAPPGKLGIAIDTLNGQPVVHRVRDESPLKGVLRRLDVIVAIDDEDTSSMTAAEVTMLMAKKLGHQRKISYLRGKRVMEGLVEKVV